jgi:hypothetical protein
MVLNYQEIYMNDYLLSIIMYLMKIIATILI